jgi:hypothetical protein
MTEIEARFVGINTRDFCVGLSRGVQSRESVLKYFHKCGFKDQEISGFLLEMRKIFELF